MVKFFYDIMFEIQCFFKEGSVEVYLVNFESVGVEVFCNDYNSCDLILQIIFFCSIIFVNIKEDIICVVFYFIIKEKVMIQDCKIGDYVIIGGYFDCYFVLCN